ncbi:MAG: MxaD family protein [Gammaproteobacteria bacterium]|nr:MAG: MxaD family protein [Gammaproteobacteria bacterium]
MLNKLIKTALCTTLLASSISVFAGDLTVSQSITVNASPETTWKMIGDFNHLDVWHPVVVKSELTSGDSQTLGSIRVLTLGNGAQITEKLVVNDNANKTYSYAITESPLPVDDYVGTITVTAAEAGKSIVTWSSTFNAKDATDEESKASTLGIYDAGLNNLGKHFN